MEYIVLKNKLYITGKAREVQNFFKEKIKLHKTLKDLIISETQCFNYTDALIKQ
ncbi:MAG: hypothetical protein GX892_12415 [Thermoanaerobacteraceae bacterium]|nr:hypothetical protein [Thermoanaerobacteraceae bacterium]